MQMPSSPFPRTISFGGGGSPDLFRSRRERSRPRASCRATTAFTRRAHQASGRGCRGQNVDTLYTGRFRGHRDCLIISARRSDVYYVTARERAYAVIGRVKFFGNFVIEIVRACAVSMGRIDYHKNAVYALRGCNILHACPSRFQTLIYRNSDAAASIYFKRRAAHLQEGGGGRDGGERH